MKLHTVAPNTTDTFQANYVGTYLICRSNSIADLGAIKVTPLGDGVLLDLDKGGAATIGQYLRIGAHTNIRIFPLTDGIYPQKITDITIENTGSSNSIDVYMPVLGQGSTYIKTMSQTMLANSQVVFDDFTALFLPNLDPGDQVTVDWEDGSSHTFDPLEAYALSGFAQMNASQYIDNRDGRVKKVTVIPGTTQSAYLIRYMPFGNL